MRLLIFNIDITSNILKQTLQRQPNDPNGIRLKGQVVVAPDLIPPVLPRIATALQ